MSDIKGLLFDKDGTLFDFSATWEAWAEGFLLRLCHNDRARARPLGRQIGFDLDTRKFARDSVVIAGTPNEIANAFLPYFPGQSSQHVVAVINEEAARAPQREAVPLVPLLSGFRARGLILGVATNDGIAPATAHLRAAQVSDFFDFVAGSDSGYGGKPAPGQMNAFLDATGLQPSQVAMIGDSTHDLRAGRAAGMITIGVLTGLADRNDLLPHADHIIPDIGYLPVWLDAQVQPVPDA